MAAQLFQNPLPNFTGLNGLPITTGYVYFGEVDQDPRTYPVSVFWDQALTLPAFQPLRTAAGYLYRNGAPSNVWIDGDYSVMVLDAKGRQVFYVASQHALTATDLDFTQAGAGAGPRTVQSKLREWVSATDFYANGGDSGVMVDPTGAADSILGIQAAIDSLTGGGDVRFSPGTFKVTAAPRMPSNVRLVGAGANATAILKTTNALGTGSALFRSGTPDEVTDSYEVDAVVLVIHEDDLYTAYPKIEGITLKKSSYAANSYGIYAPRCHHLKVEDVVIENCHNGFWTRDSWMGALTSVAVQAGAVGFEHADDGTGVGTGTSMTYTNCWANFDPAVCAPDRAFKLFGLTYSNLFSCGSDNGNRGDGAAIYAYDFNSCIDIVATGCGLENHKGGAIFMGSSTAVFTALRAATMTGVVAGTAATVFVDTASKLTLIGATFEAITVPGVMLDWIIQAGSSVIELHPGASPSGGGTSISYSGGATKTRVTGTAITRSNSTGTYSVPDQVSSSVAAIAATPVTIYTMPAAGVYRVHAYANASGTNYQSLAEITTDGTAVAGETQVTNIKAGASLTITVSGLNIQITSASTTAISYSVARQL